MHHRYTVCLQIFTNTFIKEAMHNKILAFIDKSKHALTATV